MTGATLFWLLVSLIGMAGSALCSGMEIGYYTMNRLRLRVGAVGAGAGAAAGAAPGARSAAILHRLTEQPDRVLTGLLIGNNIFNYLATLGVTTLLVWAGASEVMVVLISAAIVTPLLLIFAEALPKDIFRIEADTLMPKLARPLRIGLAILAASGLPALLSALARALGRAVGVTEDEVARDARARIAALLKEGASAGLLSASQTTLLDRALIFSRATVQDEMIPWSAVRPVRATAPAGEAARQIAPTAATVGGGAGGGGEWAPMIDAAGAPVGIVRRLDLLLADPGSAAQGSRRPLVALQPTTPLHEAAGQLARGQVGLGIVFRGGRPVGVVTLEDLAEPLTGDLAGW